MSSPGTCQYNLNILKVHESALNQKINITSQAKDNSPLA